MYYNLSQRITTIRQHDWKGLEEDCAQGPFLTRAQDRLKKHHAKIPERIDYDAHENTRWPRPLAAKK